MLAFRSSRRAVLYFSRAALGRCFDATLTDAQKGKAPPPNAPDGEKIHHFTPPPEHPEESFGKGFYLSIAAVVGTIALYKLEQSISGSDRSPLTRAIEYYSDVQDLWEQRNTRRTVLIERAATDRTLFLNSEPNKAIQVKFPEMLNNFSPRNNEIGFVQSVDLSTLREHYESQRGKQ
ncbi:hypothetical protein L873DRAFT_1830313 [Choiromyces venosus 120613-1]|uniref:Uncharacterized protein n=1 Tax=Choiromyces venosus 120613-1 TaxID=1336337 RepID=A0A3N4J8J1_9PEZI|nr:hypothetical protein L873DRAFT_1830313 [Choiromyces venosus 120613-1]